MVQLLMEHAELEMRLKAVGSRKGRFCIGVRSIVKLEMKCVKATLQHPGLCVFFEIPLGLFLPLPRLSQKTVQFVVVQNLNRILDLAIEEQPQGLPPQLRGLTRLFFRKICGHPYGSSSRRIALFL